MHLHILFSSLVILAVRISSQPLAFKTSSAQSKGTWNVTDPSANSYSQSPVHLGTWEVFYYADAECNDKIGSDSGPRVLDDERRCYSTTIPRGRVSLSQAFCTDVW